MSDINESVAVEASTLKVSDFYDGLASRVSQYNAQLLLHSASISSGISTDSEDFLNRDEAKALCLELIKKGGPAFQVGKSLYSQV